MSARLSSSGAGKFPTPKINEAQIFTSEIAEADDVRELKNILSSSSGQFYEFDLVIKKSIFGLVVRANVLEQVEVESFRRSGKQVAIKVFAKDAIKQSDAHSENPLLEIAAMQDFGEPRHPNIACQYECCADEKNVYSVLQFHQGVELFDHVLNNGPLEEKVARYIFRQLVRAMARLEQRGICHRDISLENIMYNEEDHTTTLIDFGLCVKVQKENGEIFPISNVVCGKGTYMAPESAWGDSSRLGSFDLEDEEPVSRNSFQGEELVNPFIADVWSAGMSLLFVLLGFPPVETASRDDVRYNYIVSGRLQELLVHWGVDLSDEVVDLIHAILKEDPAERLTLDQIWAHPWMMTSEVEVSSSPEPVAAVCRGLYLNSTTKCVSASPMLSPVNQIAIEVEDISTESVDSCVPFIPSPSLSLLLPSVVEPAESCVRIHCVHTMHIDEKEIIGCADPSCHSSWREHNASAVSTPSGMMSTGCTPKVRGLSFETVTPTCDSMYGEDHRGSFSSIGTTCQQYMQQTTPTSVAQLPLGAGVIGGVSCCSVEGSQFSTAVNSPTSYYSTQQGLVSPDGPLNNFAFMDKYNHNNHFSCSQSQQQHKLPCSIPNNTGSSVSNSPLKASGSSKMRPYHARSRSKGTNYEFHH